MQHTPNPILNDKELALLESPEECLRHAVGRAALSLEELALGLPPHVAAAVCGIVTGERPPAPPPAPLGNTRSAQTGSNADRIGQRQERPHWTQDSAHFWLSRSYPRLADLLSDSLLTPDEAMDAAHTVDAALGRYATGCRYAAP